MAAKDNGLSVPAAFERQALALPDKVEKAVAQLSSAKAAGKMLDEVATMEAYARRVKADTRIGNCLSYSSLLLIDKICELCPPAKRGRGNKNTSPGEGIFPSSASRAAAWRKVRAGRKKLPEYKQLMVDPAEPEEQASIRHFIDYVHVGLVTRNKGDEEWYTPSEYIEAARKVLGQIDLDPASSAIANKLVKAKKFYTAKNDGLTKKWSGRVFLNPPYKRGLVDKFVDKLLVEIEAGNVKQAILLVNNATDTEWCQTALDFSAAACFTASRVRFLTPTGDPGRPTQGQLFAYFGMQVDKFGEAFSDIGIVMAKVA